MCGGAGSACTIGQSVNGGRAARWLWMQGVSIVALMVQHSCVVVKLVVASVVQLVKNGIAGV